jgi:hypothetical protein
MQQQPPVRKLSAQKKSGPGVTQWPAHGVLRSRRGSSCRSHTNPRKNSPTKSGCRGPLLKKTPRQENGSCKPRRKNSPGSGYFLSSNGPDILFSAAEAWGAPSPPRVAIPADPVDVVLAPSCVRARVAGWIRNQLPLTCGLDPAKQTAVPGSFFFGIRRRDGAHGL